MTYEQFMDHLLGYYGSYREGTKAGSYVLRYLKKEIQQGKLEQLFEAVQRYHPLSSFAPGISDIEKAIFLSGKDNKGNQYHIQTGTGEAERLQKHKDEILSLPESERIEFESEGELFRSLMKGRIEL